MNRKYFGTDGVRGLVGQFPITPDFALKLGWAAGKVLAASGTREVIIGKDTRISGYMLESSMASGFAAAGVNVALTGPLPTPAIAYLARTFRADAGVVISASHNPYHDNGIKFFSGAGVKLNDEVELAIEAQLTQELQCVDSAHLGKARRITDAIGRYVEFCKSQFPSHLSLEGLRVVVDCAHGATYQIAPTVLCELGAEVFTIGVEPSGVNINAHCGATDLAALSAKVKELRADVGFALDGDGDRIMLVDHLGRVMDGDQILFILARHWHERGELRGGVVGTQMANLGLEKALNGLGIPFARSKVGDRYVVELLHELGWQLGGENSGHILSLSHTTTGDGIIAGLQVLRTMVERGQNLATCCEGMTLMPQVLINIRYQGQHDPLTSDAVRQAMAQAEAVFAGQGRILLRKSGTEPLLRIMAEGENETQVRAMAEQIAASIRAVTG